MTEGLESADFCSVESIDKSAELIRQYKEDCEIRGMSPESLRRYISSLKIYNQYLRERHIDLLNVDRNILRSFLEYLRKERNVGLKTVGNYFTSMAMFYEFLEYEGYVDKNPVHSVRKRYVRKYKDNDEGQMRKLISVEEMAKLINSTLDVRDKAIITLLAKTGIRRKELITLDVDDIDWIDQSIRLKPTPKRTNRIVFFDDETAIILHRWIRACPVAPLCARFWWYCCNTLCASRWILQISEHIHKGQMKPKSCPAGSG